MDQSERDELSRWVQESAELLAPPAGWEPNPKAARVRFEARLHRPSPVRGVLVIAAAALAMVFMFAAVVPVTRALAQQAGVSWHGLDQFWYWITFARNQQLVRLGLLPDEVRSLGSGGVTLAGPPQVVSDVTEASRRSGFVPRMPGSGVIPGRPRLSVLGPLSFGTAFKAAELESALRQARVIDQTVPAGWDGAWIGAQIGNRVIAEWPDSGLGAIEWTRITLTQSAPPVFALPPEIDLTSFAALNLRTTLMSRDSARRFAQYAVPPAALLAGNGARIGIGAQASVAVRYVSLRHSPAILIEEWGHLGHNVREQGPQIDRIILLWSAPDRMYVLKGELKVALELNSYDLAGAMATVIEMANTID